MKKAFNEDSKKRKEFKKTRIVKGASGTTSNVPTSKSYMCQKEKRKSKKSTVYLKK